MLENQVISLFCLEHAARVMKSGNGGVAWYELFVAVSSNNQWDQRFLLVDKAK